MKCRYCGNVYSGEDRTCGGCGAPKHAVQTLLDAPATPEHWSNSLKDTIYRVCVVTAALALAIVVLSLIGLGALGGFAAFFWAATIAPAVLTYGAWREAKGNFVTFLALLFLVIGVWMGVFMTVILSAGIAASV